MLQLYHSGQFLLMKEAEYQGKPTELNIFYLLKILTIIFGNILNIHVFYRIYFPYRDQTGTRFTLEATKMTNSQIKLIVPLVIELSVFLRFTDSVYPFGICKLFFVLIIRLYFIIVQHSFDQTLIITLFPRQE